MFEVIGNFFHIVVVIAPIVFWIIVVGSGLGRIYELVEKFKERGTGAKFHGIISIVLAIGVFFFIFHIFKSVAWSLLVGFVTGIGILEPDSPETSTSREVRDPGVLETFAQGYLEAEVRISEMEEAIRRSKR